MISLTWSDTLEAGSAQWKSMTMAKRLSGLAFSRWPPLTLAISMGVYYFTFDRRKVEAFDHGTIT